VFAGYLRFAICVSRVTCRRPSLASATLGSACVESFFGTLKRELVYHRRYETRDAARQDIFEYIEVFYNRRRRHSTLGYDSPAEFEARMAVA
jgi:transposase InsO family protein